MWRSGVGRRRRARVAILLFVFDDCFLTSLLCDRLLKRLYNFHSCRYKEKLINVGVAREFWSFATFSCFRTFLLSRIMIKLSLRIFSDYQPLYGARHFLVRQVLCFIIQLVITFCLFFRQVFQITLLYKNVCVTLPSSLVCSGLTPGATKPPGITCDKPSVRKLFCRALCLKQLTYCMDIFPSFRKTSYFM